VLINYVPAFFWTSIVRAVGLLSICPPIVANTSSTSAEVKVTLVYESGAPVRTFSVAPRSRYNIDVRAEFPGAVSQPFGALVESLGGSAVQLVVERAMYWTPSGRHGGGHEFVGHTPTVGTP
jgi:hypothetical protein